MSSTAPVGLERQTGSLTPAGSSRWSTRFARELGASYRHHLPMILLVCAYAAISTIIASLAGQRGIAAHYLELPAFMASLPAMTLYLVLFHAMRIVIIEHPKRPLTRLWQDLRTEMITPRRLAMALPLFACLPIFGASFTMVKSTIPLFHPFDWDPTLEQWDRWLTGGMAPWEVLQPLIGKPIITYWISWAYNFWFFVLTFVMAWQAFAMRDLRLRAQFFYATFITWILLGSVAATLLSSAGPCYFGRVTGLPDPYEPLFAYLHAANLQHPLLTFWAQDFLWDSYMQAKMTFGSGISAMPSLHVGMAFMFALLGWRVSRLAGLFFSLFLVVIAVGSVHLGWHYAIDGIVAIIGVLPIWWLSGWLARRHLDARPHGGLQIAKPQRA